ncbi:MAG: hypothetical protein ACRD15_09100 [Vicinamibacterales bacterium]
MPPANPADRQLADDLRNALLTLLRELLSGPADTGAFVLNRGDRGLLASLDALSAEMASAQPGGRSSVAAHVDHLRYGIELLNRWARSDDPWSTADYGASWQRQHVSDPQWSALRVALADEARAWMAACEERREWDKQGVTEALASVVHLAYHVGAIRQLAHAASGPAAAD